jgi:hypothetical protein
VWIAFAFGTGSPLEVLTVGVFVAVERDVPIFAAIATLDVGVGACAPFVILAILDRFLFLVLSRLRILDCLPLQLCFPVLFCQEEFFAQLFIVAKIVSTMNVHVDEFFFEQIVTRIPHNLGFAVVCENLPYLRCCRVSLSQTSWGWIVGLSFGVSLHQPQEVFELMMGIHREILGQIRNLILAALRAVGLKS